MTLSNPADSTTNKSLARGHSNSCQYLSNNGLVELDPDAISGCWELSPVLLITATARQKHRQAQSCASFTSGLSKSREWKERKRLAGSAALLVMPIQCKTKQQIKRQDDQTMTTNEKTTSEKGNEGDKRSVSSARQ